MIFPSSHNFYNVNIEQLNEKRFKPYLSNYDAYIPRYFFEKDPEKAMKLTLEEFGFNVKHVELRKIIHVYKSFKHLERKFCF